MKFLFLFTMLFTLHSCKLYELAKNDFKPESKITPFAKSQTLQEKYDKSIRLKIPLTESSIGYYDLEEVLGNSNMDSRHKGFFKRLKDGFKLAFFKFGVSLGFSNKIKYSTYFDFEDKIDPDFLKSAKVVRVFFTTEDCRVEEDICNTKSGYRSNFNFVDKLFVNFSNFVDQTNVDILNEQEEVETIDDNKFKEVEVKSFQQDLYQTSRTIKLLGKPDYEKAPTELNDDEFQEINIVKYKNIVPEMSFNTTQITDQDKDLYLHFKDGSKRKAVKNYFKQDKFKPFIKKVRRDRRELHLQLHRHATWSQINEIVSADQSPTSQKMVIYRLNSKLKETERYFQQEKFENVLNDVTMIGRSLYLELKDISQLKKFQNIVEADKNYIDSQLDIYTIDKCGSANCLDLEVQPLDFLPLLVKNPKLKIDTYASLRAIEGNDFKYNGYIELEIEVDFGLLDF